LEGTLKDCSPEPTIITIISQNAGSEQIIVILIKNVEGLVCAWKKDKKSLSNFKEASR